VGKQPNINRRALSDRNPSLTTHRRNGGQAQDKNITYEPTQPLQYSGCKENTVASNHFILVMGKNETVDELGIEPRTFRISAGGQGLPEYAKRTLYQLSHTPCMIDV
jgi:hypothetical protein